LSDLKLAFLGPPQISRAEQGEISLTNRKALALLAYLATEAQHAHGRVSLMALLWPELPTAAAQNNLRVTWAGLRKQLAAPQEEAQPHLLATRLTLQFNPDSATDLDVTRFRALLAASRGHQHAARADCPACAERLAEALALVRGGFLEGFAAGECPAFDEWLFVQRERLHLEVMALLEDLAGAAEANGRYPAATTYTRRQLELDPLHDSAQHRLLRLLAYQGQPNAALSHYQTVESLLDEELGIAPSTEMARLANRIKAGVPVAPPPGQAADRVEARTLNNLPANLTPFFGREAELEQLAARLAQPDYRLISLVGPGGIGKTRLALEAARENRGRWADGIFFAPLEGLAHAGEIPAAVAEALGIPLDGGASPTAEILRILGDKQLLLVIDNLEHVLEEGAGLLLDILRAAPGVVLLVTSRERLNVQAEDLFLLRGLPYPQAEDDPAAAQYTAVRLFADRAHRLRKTFRLDEETLPHVARICRLVEGLPLGLELAATWTRERSAGQIADALAVNVDLLEADLRDIPPRQRSLAAVFDYSWSLLTAVEQQVLARLSVFHGGFTPAAAERVAGATAVILTRLLYKSLMRSSGDGRYAMHELLRQFAWRKLAAGPGAVAQTEGAHGRYFLALLARREQELKGPDAAAVAVALRLEIDNIRQAWRWAAGAGERTQLRGSAAGLAAFFMHEGLGQEASRLLGQGVDLAASRSAAEDDLLPSLLATQLLVLGPLRMLDDILPLVQRLLDLTRHSPDLARLQARAYQSWSAAVLDRGADPQEAQALLERAFAAAAGLDDPELEATLLCELGRIYFFDGRFAEAIQGLQQALAIFQALGHLPGQALAYSQLAPSYAEAYNLGPALFCDQEALRLYTQINYRTKLSGAHNNLAETLVLLGAYGQAEAEASRSLALSREQNHEVNVANTQAVYAASLDGLGRTEEAETVYRAAIAAQKTLGMGWSLSYSLLDWGDFQLRAGRPLEAGLSYEEALAFNHGREHLRLTTQAKQAQVLLAQDKPQEALALAGAIWAALAPGQGRGLPFPVETLFECYTVFQSCADERATAVLQLATDVLRRTAAGIDDPQMRAAFLNSVRANRLLQAALEGQAAQDKRIL
jgi:predicted ATPase/DNA-binding SARP family transcriptional activator